MELLLIHLLALIQKNTSVTDFGEIKINENCKSVMSEERNICLLPFILSRTKQPSALDFVHPNHFIEICIILFIENVKRVICVLLCIHLIMYETRLKMQSLAGFSRVFPIIKSLHLRECLCP